MRVIVAGPRTITDYRLVKTVIEYALLYYNMPITELGEGEAQGVDLLARQWAEEVGIPVKPFPAAWRDLDAPGAVIKYNKYGPYNVKAGHDRNTRQAEWGEALIAIWNGVSTGTADMIEKALDHGLPVYVYRTDKNVFEEVTRQ